MSNPDGKSLLAFVREANFAHAGEEAAVAPRLEATPKPENQQVKEHQDVQVIARLPADQGGHPLLVAGSHGNGRTLAWTSDIGPHWLPNAFVGWPGYKRLWIQALGWLTRS